MNHIEILSTVAVIMVGIWSLMYIHQQANRLAETGLKNLFYFLLSFNIFSLYLFVYLYSFNNLNTQGFRSLLAALKIADRSIRTLLALAVFFFLFRTIAWLRNTKLPLWLITGVPAYVILLALLYRPTSSLNSLTTLAALFNYWTLWIWPLNTIVVSWLLGLYLKTRICSDPDERRMIKAFCWFFLGHIMVQITLELLSARIAINWTVPLSRSLSLYTNLIPLLWLRFFYLPWALRISKTIGKNNQLESIREHHGLTEREMEILKRIVDGKSYKEIEDILFISIHTVKTHVYNLYRKTGVNSRHGLIHKLLRKAV